MDLALVYYQAISIYLSGIFDYHQTIYTRFKISTPTLSVSDITYHLKAILDGVDAALHSTRLPGILFVFPLRVAGARATERAQQQRIKDMLKIISTKGFVVSQAFEEDLEFVWEKRRRSMSDTLHT